jgi:hypothetical protein
MCPQVFDSITLKQRMYVDVEACNETFKILRSQNSARSSEFHEKFKFNSIFLNLSVLLDFIFDYFLIESKTFYFKRAELTGNFTKKKFYMFKKNKINTNSHKNETGRNFKFWLSRIRNLKSEIHFDFVFISYHKIR